jgi:pSer/pThr/pTyr-binding forkhead associated (FHA) protein
MSFDDRDMEAAEIDTLTEPDEDVIGEPRLPVITVIGSATEGSRRRQVIPFIDVLTIGRAASTLAVGRWRPRDDLVSRQHARVTAGLDVFEVADLGSRNDTFFQGKKLIGARKKGGSGLLFVGRHAAVLRFASGSALKTIEEDEADPFTDIPTASPRVALLHYRLRLVARTDAPILLTGAAGTGKKTYAQAVHRKSGRKGPLYVVDCSILHEEPDCSPEMLLSRSRLIYGRGNETEGTLVLARVDKAPPRNRTRVSQILTSPGPLVVKGLRLRVIATSEDADLLDYPKPPETFRLPSLRNRQEDFVALLEHLAGERPVRLSRAAFFALSSYGWPGNVRQLEVTIASLRDGAADLPRPVTLRDLPSQILNGSF